MTAEYKLEGPDNADDLYQARGEDVGVLVHRPLFTGDVLRLGDERLVALIQHPCSMRRGPKLVRRLQAAEVKPWDKGAVPSDWNTHTRRMFLPKFDGQGDWTIEFDDIELVESSEADVETRQVILSQKGVNILVQRLAYYLTRLVVPTLRINEMISGQFDEADLIGEEVDELVRAQFEAAAAHAMVHAWLDEGPRGRTRRDLLHDPQQKSAVRKDLRAQIRAWIESPQVPVGPPDSGG